MLKATQSVEQLNQRGECGEEPVEVAPIVLLHKQQTIVLKSYQREATSSPDVSLATAR